MGQVDLKKEAALVSFLRDRAYDALKICKAENFYKKDIPSNAEAQLDYLIKELPFSFFQN